MRRHVCCSHFQLSALWSFFYQSYTLRQYLKPWTKVRECSTRMHAHISGDLQCPSKVTASTKCMHWKQRKYLLWISYFFNPNDSINLGQFKTKNYNKKYWKRRQFWVFFVAFFTLMWESNIYIIHKTFQSNRPKSRIFASNNLGFGVWTTWIGRVE